MKDVLTVFRKEGIDTLRDRRTLLFMIIIPLLMFPVFFQIVFSVQKGQADEAREKELRVACIDPQSVTDLRSRIEGNEGFALIPDVPEDSIRTFIGRGKLDGAFVVDDDFAAAMAANEAGRIDLYFKSTDDSRIVRNRLRELVDDMEETILEERFERLDLDRDIVDGVDLKERNVASQKQRVAQSIGGFLPYMFILFCFLGAMYPAIDLGAGEKERGTMETLLTAPVNRFHILLGKFLVVVLSGLASASVAMLGLFISIRLQPDIPEEFFELLGNLLGAGNVVLILTLMIPLAVFFAGLLLSLSITAKSFKEAQSLISPLNFMIIVPAFIGMLPGIELGFTTALIPILNVSLATKAIMAGEAPAGLLALTYGSLAVFAMLSLLGATQWFKRESTIFRT